MEPQLNAVPVMDSQSKWAKPEDWTKYRNTISALFMCHSLPNVMRIMREDHNFHATPKMYQVHIYQKWGLRKGRPESNKSKKKRRREATEEPEPEPELEQDEYEPPPHQAQPTVQNVRPRANVQRHQLDELDISHYQPGMPIRQGVDDPNSAFFLGAPPQRGIQQHPDGMQAHDDELQAALAPLVSHIEEPWQHFIPTPDSDQLFVSPDGNGLPGTQMIIRPATDPSVSADSSGSWMSTVLVPTPPSSGAASSRVVPATSSAVSLPSRGSHVSSSHKTPRSQASSSRTSLLSSTSSRTRSSKAARITTSRMTLPTSAIRALDSPSCFLFSEKSMFFARHYISSTFSTGLWTLSQNADPTLLDTECVKLDAWYNNFNPGFEYLFENRSNQPDRIKRAFCIFQQCFAATEAIIEPQDPRLVIYICQQTIRFMFYDTVGRNLAQTFLRYVSNVCRKLFTEHHPLYVIMSQLARMDNFEFAQNVPSLMECYFDHLEPFLDEQSYAFNFVNDLRGLTISIMEATGMLGVYEAKPVLDRLVARAEKLGHKNLHLKIEQAAVFQRNRYFIEARDMLRAIRNSPEGQNDPYEATYAAIILMVVYRKMKDTEAGIHLGYQMVNFIENIKKRSAMADFNWELYKGLGPSTLMIFLGKLEVELRDANRFDEADEIHAKMDRVMANQYEYDVEKQREGLEENMTAST